MSKDIKIKKGLDIKLIGEADKVTKDLPHSTTYSIYPDDFHLITPKLLVKDGEKVKAGEAIYYSKDDERIKITSPVSGEIAEIIRGAKRKILEIKILADREMDYKDFGAKNPKDLSAQEVKEFLAETGCFPLIKRRPYDIPARFDDQPKAIFITGFSSAPLAHDYDYSLKDKKKELQAGVDALTQLTEGKVHLTVSANSTVSVLNDLDGVTKHTASGPHPAGNASIHIAHVDPISKGEIVWVLNPMDLATIGETFLTGKKNDQITISVSGSEVNKSQYLRVIRGAAIADILKETSTSAQGNRIISGDIFTGTIVQENEALRYLSHEIVVIPDGEDYDFMGWQLPRPNKPSFYRVDLLNWLGRAFNSRKTFAPSANTNGEHRAFVLTGNFEKVFPLDIYPMQLIKSCMIGDLENMEELGIYEVAPEDFALTEFIDVSKHNHQEIVRKALDTMVDEIGF